MEPLVSIKITEITLLNVKEYLRIDHDDDDILLKTMIAAAQSFIQSYLNRKFTDFEELPGEFTIACLALVAHWYEQREIQPEKSAKELNYLFAGLLDMHRDWNATSIKEDGGVIL